MRLVTLLLPEAYLQGLDRLVGMGTYHSRSAVIRYAVMDLLKKELWRQEREGEQERKRNKARGAVKELAVATRKGTKVTRKGLISRKKIRK